MERYDVCIVFNVSASDDDEALNKVTQTLKHDTFYNWAWIYTTEKESHDIYTTKESSNGTNTNTQ